MKNRIQNIGQNDVNSKSHAFDLRQLMLSKNCVMDVDCNCITLCQDKLINVLVTTNMYPQNDLVPYLGSRCRPTLNIQNIQPCELFYDDKTFHKACQVRVINDRRNGLWFVDEEEPNKG